jgi:hypothetical protein
MVDSFCRAHGRRARWASPAQLAAAGANPIGAAPSGAQPVKLPARTSPEPVAASQAVPG